MNSNTKKPQCISSKDHNKFLVVSYCHLDKDVVFRELCALEEQKASFWYDDSNLIGDDWLNNIKKQIDADLCIGVILFISENTFLSPSVLEELKYINLVYETRKLMLLPVLIDNASTIEAIDLNSLYARSLQKIVATTMPSNINEMTMQSINILNILKQMLHDENMLFGRTCPMLKCNNACPNAKSYPCQYRNFVIEKLKQNKALATFSYTEEDLEKEAIASNLIVPDTYKGQKIKWLNVFKDNDIYTFVSNKVLEPSFEENINETLAKIKNHIKMVKYGSEWEWASNDAIRLLSEEEYLSLKPKLMKYILKKNTTQNINIEDEEEDMNYNIHEDELKYVNDYWWITTNNQNKKFVLADGNIATHVLYDNEKLGIRPVIMLKNLKKE